MSGNGGQKNLEELKKSVHVIVAKDFAPNDRLWIHPFVPHFPSPPPPPAIWWPKGTHFHPLCPKFNIVWGEKGFCGCYKYRYNGQGPTTFDLQCTKVDYGLILGYWTHSTPR